MVPGQKRGNPQPHTLVLSHPWNVSQAPGASLQLQGFPLLRIPGTSLPPELHPGLSQEDAFR